MYNPVFAFLTVSVGLLTLLYSIISVIQNANSASTNINMRIYKKIADERNFDTHANWCDFIYIYNHPTNSNPINMKLCVTVKTSIRVQAI